MIQLAAQVAFTTCRIALDLVAFQFVVFENQPSFETEFRDGH